MILVLPCFPLRVCRSLFHVPHPFRTSFYCSQDGIGQGGSSWSLVIFDCTPISIQPRGLLLPSFCTVHSSLDHFVTWPSGCVPRTLPPLGWAWPSGHPPTMPVHNRTNPRVHPIINVLPLPRTVLQMGGGRGDLVGSKNLLTDFNLIIILKNLPNFPHFKKFPDCPPVSPGDWWVCAPEKNRQLTPKIDRLPTKFLYFSSQIHRVPCQNLSVRYFLQLNNPFT